MRAPYQIFLPFLSLFLVRVDLTDVYPLKIRSKLLEVMDGDTLRVEVGEQKRSLRLLYLDAPELSQKIVGVASRDCVKKYLKEREEFYFYLHGFDVYQRMLGEIDEGNLVLVKLGCSGLYVRSEFKNKKMKMDFIRSLIQARERRVGIWSKEKFLRPDLYRKISKRIAHRQ